MPTQQEIRDANIAYLNENGFTPATWMPLPNKPGEPSDEPGYPGGILRDESEIANRLLCFWAVFAWGSAPLDFEQPNAEFIANNGLRDLMTGDERTIVDLPKLQACQEHSHLVGWRLENMWSLAWVLGLASEPSATTGQLPDEASGALMGLFMPDFAATADSLLAQGATQPIENIIQMEDLFYLAHNAVRGAQIDDKGRGVPSGFDPIGDGGAIHERRHGLTWALSPGADWNDTDLST